MMKRKVNNRYTGIYRTSDIIDNLHIRITLKKLYSIIQIPKFEQVQLGQPADQQTTDFVERIELRWQEKIFSKTEFTYYSQKENCKSELEKKYHQIIKEQKEGNDNECGLIFTYIDDDNYQPNDNFGPNELKITQLRKNVEEINENKIDQSIGLFANENETSLRYAGDKNFIKMFIMADLDPTILLFTIQYRKSDGLFIVYPDFNDESNCYYLEIDQNSKQMYTYCMENLSTTSNEMTQKIKQKQKLDELQEETCELMKKLSFSIKDQNFNFPKFCRIVLLMEIESARFFDHDNLHVQFKFKLPNFVRVIEGKVEGATHSSYKNEKNIWNFGYCHCLVIDIDDEFLISNSEMDKILINFDVISIDNLWQRERREGITSIKIPLEETSSNTEYNLQCFRELQGGSSFVDFLERFFLGGIRSIKYNEHAQQGAINFYGNSTVTTGNLKVKVQQIRQIRQSYRKNLRIQSIDDIISSYHRAKAKLN
ncbi:hypothetical protein PVAND_001459 [Polypedilum vanderplanki]|uniref:Meckel syndrome type 1 protein n=1 Tax=Polypedilum vanderplanki TaxID=319348 RepID=A0A9J6BN95_POLVA|nr:hypothetical protein PVAND_001459 [Polypedilum vanderplanki]